MAGTIVANTINTDTAGSVFTTNNAYLGMAKAWVNYNGATQTINNSFNVSSVTRNSTGDYTLNFATAMPNANYSICGLTSNVNGSIAGGAININSTSATTQQAPTTSAFRFLTPSYSWSGLYDMQYVNVAVFSS